MGQNLSGHGMAAAPAPQVYEMHAKILGGFCELVRELGGRPDALLKSAGVSARMIDDPSAMAPVRAMGQLLEDAAALLRCPDFGLRLAERQSMRSVMRPLDGLYCTAPTIREALLVTVRHMGAFNSGLMLSLDETPDQAMHLVDYTLLDGLALFPQLIELLVLLTHKSVVWLSAGFAQSRRIWFTHLAVSSPAAYARRFNAVVEFGQECDGLFFHEADLRARVAECNADRFASERLRIEQRYPARPADIDLKVRQAIFRILAQSNDCTRQNIAQYLGFQERTLNRRLSKRGTSFETIRDEVRRDLAYRYLSRADLPLTEIAGRLGYSELAVLSRCCRRWFGTSPRRLRQNLQMRKVAAPGDRAPLRLHSMAVA